MADSKKENLEKALHCIEQVLSFASSMDPIFGIVSSLVKVARKGLAKNESHPLDKEFKPIHSKLETISEKNQQCLSQIRINEVIETFGKYEGYIKNQYDAFNTMVAQVKEEPEKAKTFFKNYEENYKKYKGILGLNTYYGGVQGTVLVFGRTLLKVYLDNCDRDLEIMERRCSHIIQLFHVGFIALMAYTAVTEDDEDQVRVKWGERVLEIQQKIQEALSQCKPKTS